MPVLREMENCALNPLVGDHKMVFEASYTQVHQAIRRPVQRAVKSGDLRKDLHPGDLLRVLGGVANVARGPDWRQSATAWVGRVQAREASQRHFHHS